MTAYFLAQPDLLLMSPQATTSCGQPQNVGETLPTSMNVPIFGGLTDCRPEEPFHSQYYSHDVPQSTAPLPSQQLQFIQPSPPSYPLFQEGYHQSMGPSVFTMVGAQNLYPSSSRYPMPPVQAALSPTLLPGYLQSSLPFQSRPAVYDSTQQVPESQGESVFSRGKRQRDESYRYSLSYIHRRVKMWLDKIKGFSNVAQIALEDSLCRDADISDENFLEMFDASRRKRLSTMIPADCTHISESSISGNGLQTPSCLSGSFSYHQSGFSYSYPTVGSASEEIHGAAAPVDQEYIVNFPKVIPPVCPTAGIKVHYGQLTDRSVLRGWRCRTDEADCLLRRGRKRFYKRVAVLPPDNWQPNKRAQVWEWAPSGPFALSLGEYVSVSGTNGYPYMIVLIRHIHPAQRSFMSLIPAPRDIALQMLNEEDVAPERQFIPHLPVDSVTHKWILNGVRPKDISREMARFFIEQDLEMDRTQKVKRKARKGELLSSTDLSSESCSTLQSVESLVSPAPDEECFGPVDLAEGGACPTSSLMFDSSLLKQECAIGV